MTFKKPHPCLYKDETGQVKYVGYLGPIDSRFGYGRGGIAILRALTMLRINASVTPYYNGMVGCEPYVQDLVPEVLSQLVPREFSPCLELMHCPPDSFDHSTSMIRIGWTMWETDQIPNGSSRYFGNWSMLINRWCDALVVPSEHNKEVFSRCGVKKPIFVIPYGVDTIMWPFKLRVEKEKFSVLLYGDLSSRKGVLESVQAFKLAFAGEKDVQLVLKTQNGQLGLGLFKVPNFDDERIVVINEAWDHSRLLKLVHDSDCLIWLSRGEGFGLPPLEATLTGLPVIMTYHTGMAQYFKPEYFFGVPVVGTSPSPLGGHWYEPNVTHAALQLRTIYENRIAAFKKAALASEYIGTSYNMQIFAQRLQDLLNHY
jgi:glycosyltransferase involved in cell wall biosynthesis